MRLKMKVGLSGNQYTLAPGDERDFPAKEGKRLIAAGFADEVKSASPAKASTVRPRASKAKA